MLNIGWDAVKFSAALLCLFLLMLIFMAASIKSLRDIMPETGATETQCGALVPIMNEDDAHYIPCTFSNQGSAPEEKCINIVFSALGRQQGVISRTFCGIIPPHQYRELKFRIGPEVSRELGQDYEYEISTENVYF